jgi:hypothetical protein
MPVAIDTHRSTGSLSAEGDAALLAQGPPFTILHPPFIHLQKTETKNE